VFNEGSHIMKIIVISFYLFYQFIEINKAIPVRNRERNIRSNKNVEVSR